MRCRPAGFLVALTLLAVLVPGRARAKTYPVDTFDDLPSDGHRCVDMGFPCSLRAAIQDANANYTEEDNVINLMAGTYRLTIPGPEEEDGATGDLDIVAKVTIVGQGTGGLLGLFCRPSSDPYRAGAVLPGGCLGGTGAYTVIDGNLLDRVFDVRVPESFEWVYPTEVRDGATFARVKIQGVVITGGRVGSGVGGAIRNNGELRLDDVLIIGNEAPGGGGLFNGGSARLVNVTAALNGAADACGGGVKNAGVISLQLSALIQNTSRHSSGGGVCNRPDPASPIHTTGFASNRGTLGVQDSTISDNHAAEKGGGVSTLGGVRARPASGLDRTAVVRNHARDGGGIAIERNPVPLGSASDSLWTAEYLIALNSAHAAEASGGRTDSDTGRGGGVYSDNGLRVSWTSVRDNTASTDGGGIFLGGAEDRLVTLNASFSEISRNRAGVNAAGFSGSGGGLWLSHGLATLLNVTVSSNTAGRGGGIAATDIRVLSLQGVTVMKAAMICSAVHGLLTCNNTTPGSIPGVLLNASTTPGGRRPSGPQSSR
jgi:predicted outer membrane repeat protein